MTQFMPRDLGDELLKEAIAGTEKEIFDDGIGAAPPSDDDLAGDRSVEEMGDGLEGQLEADDADPGEVESEAEGEGETKEVEAGIDKPEGEGKTKPQQDPKTGQFVAKKEGEAAPADKPIDGKPAPRVPLGELTSERKARQDAEARATVAETALADERKKGQDQFAQLNARLDQIMAGTAPKPQQQQTDTPPKPDIFTDPDAFIADLSQGLERKFQQKFVAADLTRTHQAQGEKFVEAYTALTNAAKTDRAAAAEINKIWDSVTPGSDIIAWHTRQLAYAKVGADPAAYEEKIRTETRETLMKDPEFRKQIVADLQAEANGTKPAVETGGRPRTVTRMPKSLNGAAGGNGALPTTGFSGDNSERGVFDDAFRA